MLATRQRAPQLLAAIGQDREGLIGTGQRVGCALATDRRLNDTVRFSSTLSDEKMARPSGTCTMPSRAMRWAGHLVTSWPSKRIEPLEARDESGHHPGQGRLPGTVGPDESDDPVLGD